MKSTRIATLALLGVILVSIVACGNASLIKPTVTYVPPGWSLVSNITPQDDGFRLGSELYESTTGVAMVRIMYGDISDWYKNDCETCFKEDIPGYLNWLFNLEISGTEEFGEILVCGQTAAYGKDKKHVETGDYTLMIIMFIQDNTEFEFVIHYASAKDYTDAMALINSIEF